MKPAVARFAAALCRPREFGQRKATLLVIALSLAALACVLMLRMWFRNQTPDLGLTIAGLFMVSDASNYFECSNWLLDYGKVGNSWCERRPIYAALLAGLSGITGRVWLLTMLAQAVLVTLCVLAFARSVTRQAGLVAGVSVLAMMFAYAYIHAFPGTMTENGGVMLGALGTAFLLDGSRSLNARMLFVGTALLSVGLFARAGPMLMLPGLIAWVLALRWQKRVGWTVVGVVLCGVAAGPILQMLVTFLGDGGLSNAQGNFSYTLYGLATGGRGWSVVMEDHPHVAALIKVDEVAAAREIYRLALHAFLENPTRLIRGLVRELLNYLRAPMFDVPGALLWRLPTLCWWIGGVFILMRRSNPSYALLSWLSVGVVLSAPVIGRDGGARLYAAGFAVMALQTALGLRVLVAPLAKLWQGSPVTAAADMKPGLFEHAMVGIVALLMLIPLSPLRWLLAQPEVDARACAQGLRSVVVRLGYETHFLAIVPEAKPADALRMRVAQQRMERRLLPGSWINEGVTALPKPITIVRAWPRYSKGGPGETRFFWPGDLSNYNYQTLHACLDEKENVSVAFVPYARAVSVVAIPASSP